MVRKTIAYTCNSMSTFSNIRKIHYLRPHWHLNKDYLCWMSQIPYSRTYSNCCFPTRIYHLLRKYPMDGSVAQNRRLEFRLAGQIMPFIQHLRKLSHRNQIKCRLLLLVVLYHQFSNSPKQHPGILMPPIH